MLKSYSTYNSSNMGKGSQKCQQYTILSCKFHEGPHKCFALTALSHKNPNAPNNNTNVTITGYITMPTTTKNKPKTSTEHHYLFHIVLFRRHTKQANQRLMSSCSPGAVLSLPQRGGEEGAAHVQRSEEEGGAGERNPQAASSQPSAQRLRACTFYRPPALSHTQRSLVGSQDGTAWDQTV